MNVTKRFAFFLIFGLIAIQAACTDRNSEPIRLGTNVWPGYEPLYLAREKSMLDESKVKLIEYPSASEVIRAFRNRSLDAASLTLDEALLLRQDGFSIKIVLIHDISAGGDVVLAKPEIKSFQQLKGMRVGVESGALGAFVVTRALEINNMSVQDIKIVSTDVNHHVEQFLDGKLDAVVTFEPVRTELLKLGAHEIFSSKEIPNEVVDVLVVDERVLRNRKNTLTHLVNVWFDATSLLHNDELQTAEIMAKRLKISPADVIRSFNGLYLPDRVQNIELLTSVEYGLPATLTRLNKVLVENKLLSKNIDTVNLTDVSLLK